MGPNSPQPEYKRLKDFQVPPLEKMCVAFFKRALALGRLLHQGQGENITGLETGVKGFWRRFLNFFSIYDFQPLLAKPYPVIVRAELFHFEPT